MPLIDAIAEAALRVRDDVIVLCHGGPIAMPEDAEFILQELPRTATASTAPRAWSGCRSRSR